MLIIMRRRSVGARGPIGVRNALQVRPAPPCPSLLHSSVRDHACMMGMMCMLTKSMCSTVDII